MERAVPPGPAWSATATGHQRRGPSESSTMAIGGRVLVLNATDAPINVCTDTRPGAPLVTETAEAVDRLAPVPAAGRLRPRSPRRLACRDAARGRRPAAAGAQAAAAQARRAIVPAHRARGWMRATAQQTEGTAGGALCPASLTGWPR